MSKESQQIEVVYRQANDYRVVAGTSFAGGGAGNAQLLVQVLLEFSAPPDKILHEITPDQKIGPEVSREPANRRVYREAQVGILLTETTAQSLIKWLQDNLAKMQRRQPKAQE